MFSNLKKQKEVYPISSLYHVWMVVGLMVEDVKSVAKPQLMVPAPDVLTCSGRLSLLELPCLESDELENEMFVRFSERARVVFQHLNADAKNRIWQHLLHEEEMFNSRINLFFVAQSLLLASFSVMYGKITAVQSIVYIFAGVIFSFLWLSVNQRQLYHLEAISEIAKVTCHEFIFVCESHKRHPRFSKITLYLLAFVMPLTTLAVWITLLLGTWW